MKRRGAGGGGGGGGEVRVRGGQWVGEGVRGVTDGHHKEEAYLHESFSTK